MNLRSLFLVHDSRSDAIRALATQNGLDPVVALGVAKLLLANDGNLASLSPRQRQHFDAVIKPLLDEQE